MIYCQDANQAYDEGKQINRVDNILVRFMSFQDCKY
jgi:hypothetical protein